MSVTEFRRYGTCRCGKTATGELFKLETPPVSLGLVCTQCAKMIAASLARKARNALKGDGAR